MHIMNYIYSFIYMYNFINKNKSTIEQIEFNGIIFFPLEKS